MNDSTNDEMLTKGFGWVVIDVLKTLYNLDDLEEREQRVLLTDFPQDVLMYVEITNSVVLVRDVFDGNGEEMSFGITDKTTLVDEEDGDFIIIYIGNKYNYGD